MSLKEHLRPIVTALLVVFACLGLARFAFGMVLPSMQHELGMNATQAGIVGSANFVGYFLGLFALPTFYRRFGPALLISRALWTQALSMVLMVLMPHYLLIALFFCVSGFFGALANIGIMTYIAQVVPPSIKGKATGIVVAGIGLAIIASGVIVPLIELLFPEPWRASWGLFGLLIALIAFFAYGVLHAHPTPHTLRGVAHDSLTFKQIISTIAFWQTGMLFCFFGMSAIMFMTFFVAAISETWGTSTSLSGTFWALLGISSLFSGPFFGQLSDRIGRYKTLALLFSLQALAHGMIALHVPFVGVLISALLFGFSTWAVPSIMAALSSELFGPSHTPRILSLITLFFGVGQMVGPLVAGIMRDATGSYALAFGTTACILLGGVGIALSAKAH